MYGSERIRKRGTPEKTLYVDGSNSRLPGLLLPLLVTAHLAGCCLLSPYRTPEDIDRWQDASPPVLTLAEKAARYQAGIEARHQLADGVIRYRTRLDEDGPRPGHGNLADGSFFQGLYLASQALRLAATGDAAAREQVLIALRGMELYAAVSGQRGLLARYISPEKPDDDRWVQSPWHPEYFWRSDVSKDQYAGYVHGLGVTLAVVQDAEIRARVAALASAIADHLIEHDLRIIDWDGERTRFGDLRGRQFGVPFGVDALICLSIAKVAAASTRDRKYVSFYRRLLRDGYLRLSRGVRLVFFERKRVNAHMAYLAIYPLLALETDPQIRLELQRTERVMWRAVKDEYNGLFSFVHASVGDWMDELRPGKPASGAVGKGRDSLRLFPDDKIAWPVDLSRPQFDFPRAFFTDGNCRPQSAAAVPPYLRARSSSLWVSNPYRLVSRLANRGDVEYSGIDYLEAYWMGRYYRFVRVGE